MERDYSKLPEADVVVNYICSRYSKGYYTLIFTAGLPGTGKSSVDQRLAELISVALTGENHITADNIIDNLLEFTRFVRKAKPSEVNICVLEEVSVLFPSRRAMSGDNVALARILDTCRKKKVIILANAPLWTSIDSHMRALGHLYIETLRIHKKIGIVISKVLRLQTNPSSGKTYYHYLSRKGREVQRIFTQKPQLDTWNEYEKKKDKFMDELYERLEHEAKQKKDKALKEMGKLPKREMDKRLTPQELKVYDLVVVQKKTYRETAEAIGKSKSLIGHIMGKIEQKTNIILENKPKQWTKDKKEALR